MLEIGAKGVYQNVLPDFMVWNRSRSCPSSGSPSAARSSRSSRWWWFPASSRWSSASSRSGAASAASTSRSSPRPSRCARGSLFNRNAHEPRRHQRTLRLQDHASGFPSTSRAPSAASTSSPPSASAPRTCFAAGIMRSPAGKVLVAIRDSETRVLFSRLLARRLQALRLHGVGLPGRGGGRALCRRRSASSRPARIGVLPSIEMIIWVAVGGRGTLIGPIVGAFGVNWLQSVLTTHYPDLWLLVLGGLFVASCSSSPTEWWAPPRSSWRASA